MGHTEITTLCWEWKDEEYVVFPFQNILKFKAKVYVKAN